MASDYEQRKDFIRREVERENHVMLSAAATLSTTEVGRAAMRTLLDWRKFDGAKRMALHHLMHHMVHGREGTVIDTISEYVEEPDDAE